MRTLLALLLLTLLSACAVRLPPPSGAQFWDDARYGAVPLPGDHELMALSEPMREFLRNELRASQRQHGLQAGLFMALRDGGHLRLEYDSSRTRTAAEAFEARAGNCLSLVLMTAALAQEMGLSVRYQWVDMPELWSRSAQFALLNGHINISLSHPLRSMGVQQPGSMTIDFQAIDDPRLVRVRPLDEATVFAMFFNNRAVEAMEEGNWALAHAALKAAHRHDPRYLNVLNTLAVLHRRNGDLPRAELALRTLLEHEPQNRHAAANLVLVLESLGRTAEAKALAASLPPSPFIDYERGLAYAAEGRWAEALAAYERQLRSTPDFHGLRLDLARAHVNLGQLGRAKTHLEVAALEAPTIALRDRYQAKLQALRRMTRI
jgi:tetratricopeptide (TPR) repeat protein